MRSITWKDTTSINICDEALIGKTLKEGKLQMQISRDYFGGQIVAPEQALKMMKESSIINLAGEQAVSIAISNNMGAKEAVRLIQGVPFLMIYKFAY